MSNQDGPIVKSIADIAESIHISSVKGRVLATQVWSETHVRGSGSGVVVKGFGVGSSKTTSTVVNQREICIQTDNGGELIERLNANAIGVMPDQTVVVVRAAKSDRKEGKTVGVLNCSTGEKFIDTSSLFLRMKLLLVGSIFATLLAILILIINHLQRFPNDTADLVAFVMLFGNVYWLRALAIHRAVKERIEQRMMRESGRAEEPRFDAAIAASAA